MRGGLSYDQRVQHLFRRRPGWLPAGRLRAVWDEPRPAGAPARVWRDWALVAVLMPAGLVEGIFRPDLPWRVVSTVLAVGLVPTLLWRRTRPLLVVAIGFGATGLAQALMGGHTAVSYTLAFLLILLYALPRWGSGREVLIGLAIVLVNVTCSLVFNPGKSTDTVGAIAVVCSALALGTAFRYRAGARQRQLDQVKLLERVRLARDLHDTVGHHVSAIAIRAQAGIAMSAAHPEAAADALRVIEAEASQALTEMRAMVRVLRRDQPAELAPGRRIADLAGLAGGARAGPQVDVGISGDVDDLSPSVGAAIYRLAQESITNARRHARQATRIEVRVVADDSSVCLRVSDDGDTADGRPPASPGYGLIGMIERADLLGGSFRAGPDPAGGWTVTAVLPRIGATR